MKNLENGAEFVWPQEKFRDRLYQMKEMYDHYEDENEWDREEVSIGVPVHAVSLSDLLTESFVAAV